MFELIGNLFSDQASLDDLQFDAVEFVCPACRNVPREIKENGSTITLRPCEHTFRHSDLAPVIEHLGDLDELTQRHDAAPTPLERHGIREEIHAVGVELDAAVERCETQMVSTSK